MTEAEQDAIDHLDRLAGIQELRAGILALLLPAGSKRASRAWKLECAGSTRAVQVREWIQAIPATARLPLFETLLSRMGGQPLDSRQALLEATRRVMTARGVMRPIDRLHWLEMRQRMGENTNAATRTAALSDLSQLPQTAVSAMAMYTAFLSRMVPVEAAEHTDPLLTEPGKAWYASVMAPWASRGEVPACEPPDTDGLVHSLQELQGMAWMQRPLLARSWVLAAIDHSKYGRLSDLAADALRLSCSLLDSPLPPELSRHYGWSAPDTMS